MAETPTDQVIKIKPVFPLLYLCVFVWTVVSMYSALIFGEAPPIVNVVPGEFNQKTLFFFIAAFALVLCVYNVLYYAVLELFEHHETICSATPPLALIAEFALRFLLVGVVALKIVKYEAFNNLFLFVSVISFLLLVWLLTLGKCNVNSFGKLDVAVSSIVLILATSATYILSIPAAQTDYAMVLLFISWIITIALAGMVMVLLHRFGLRFIKIVKDFVTSWS